MARLERDGLQPAPEADRTTLIRRLSLDLTGLPPTPAEVEAFVHDESQHAYEHVVDRLLMSPRYGEHMAAPWLDHARYADSNGFQSDGSRDIWAWRDWVIHAFNSNLSFDQFTIEQIAGDMLPNATREQIIATGFNRNHRLNGEGGRIVEEWFAETVIDRVETTGLTWLGLTLNCCRCHDHKFDPITQREFYQLFAFFNSVEESGVLAPAGKNGENTPPLLTLDSPAHDRELTRLQAAVTTAQDKISIAQETLPAAVAAWEAKWRTAHGSDGAIWRIVENAEITSQGGATFIKQPDGGFLASGDNPPNDVYVWRAAWPAEQLSAVLLEVAPDASLPNASLGRGFNGNFVLTDVEVVVHVAGQEARQLHLARAAADYEQAGWTARSVLAPQADAGVKRKGWAIDGNDPAKRLPRRIQFVSDQPLDTPAGGVVEVTLRHRSQFADHNVGRLRLSLSAADPATIDIEQDATPADIVAILETAASERSTEQASRLQDYVATHPASELATAKTERKQAQDALQDYRDRLPTTMVMKEASPREAHILVRGEYDKPGEVVQRGVPQALHPFPAQAPMNRLGLAQWIVDPANPLTARVWVNRLWARLFGVGLVKTTENLGSQAEYPSHPALLDWLAVEFIQPSNVEHQAWDMKAILKLIVMSATYRQASQVTDTLLTQDPENRFLARSPRFRLSAEGIRDRALAVSGLLVEKLGGPSVRPYMPAGVWDETSKYGNLRNYQHDQGDGLYRRSLYTIWKRTAAPPSMLLFDAPNREVCTIKRSRTNTPLQSLSLLNETTFVEAARKLAQRMTTEAGPEANDRLHRGFYLALSRPPTESELQVLLHGYHEDVAYFERQPEQARELLTVGEAPLESELPASQLAAFVLAANVMMNLDEFVMRD